MERWTRAQQDALEARIRAVDPDLVAAADEVDAGYLAWCLSLTPRERLAASRNATRGLARLRRGDAPA